MGSKRAAKNVLANGGAKPSTTKDTEERETLISEEEYRSKFEPVAPWKRKNIPDYGPLHENQHVFIFILVGLFATLFYEFTE